MSCENPTHGQRAVPLDLPAPQIAILRCRLRSWLAGAREDLEIPERLSDPAKCRREAEAYERLLTGIGWGVIVVPDEEARTFLAAAAVGSDKATEYERVKAEHEVLHSLLALLEVA